MAAAVVGHDDPSLPHPVASVSVSFDLETSHSGAPVFEVGDIGPGDGTSGTVTIANDGDEAGELRLSQHDVIDTPGSLGPG